MPYEAKSPVNKAAAGFILVTVCIDMLTVGVVIPVLAQLVKSFLDGSVSRAGLWMGVFGAGWGLAQFIFSPIQGGLSDWLGRRPVVLASNFGTGVDFLLMAMAPNLWWLLVGRIISGITSASISTAYAYMSDVTPAEQRAKVFGLMGAAFGFGFVVGPGLGGVLGGGIHWPWLHTHGLSWLQFNGNPHYPFFFAAFLSLINFGYGFFFLPESLPLEKRKPFSFHVSSPIGGIKFLSRSGQVLRLALMYLLMMFAQNVFPTTMVLYADYRFGWGPNEVAVLLIVVGVMQGFTQAVLTGAIVRKLGERGTMFLGLICGVIAFAGYTLAPNWQVFVAFVPVGALWGLTTPNIQALMSAKVDPKEQGTLQGASMGLASMATIFAPLCFGALLSFVTHPGVPKFYSGAAFGLSLVIMVLTVIMGLGVKQSLKVSKAYESGAAE